MNSKPATSTRAEMTSPTGTAYYSEGISFKTSDGVIIKGAFFRPNRLKMKSVPVVILLHMLGRTRSDWAEFVPLLMDEGYSALSIDLRGHGESTAFGSITRSWRSFYEADFRSMKRDVEAAAAWLESRHDVNSDRIAIIGASIGANLAINYAVTDEHVRTVILLSPGLDYRGVETGGVSKKYGPRAVMIVASNEDEPSFSGSEALYDILKETADPAKFKIYSGKSHGTNILNLGNGLDMIMMAWLGNNLLF